MGTKTKETKVRLDREVVIAAAISLTDAEGLDALTIRRLSSELGVTPMALYWHFDDKQALINAIIDEMWADAWRRLEPHLRAEEGHEWEALRHVLNAMVEIFRGHASLARFAPLRITECEEGLSITEQTLELLSHLGMNPEQAAGVARFALCASIMLVDDQPGIEYHDLALREEMVQRKMFGLSRLSPERYPRTLAAAPYLIACASPDYYYEAGIDLIIGGMKAQVA